MLPLPFGNGSRQWIFELRRIENEPSILACPPYFKLKKKLDSISSYPLLRAWLLRCERKKWVMTQPLALMRLTFGNKTTGNNREIADCTAPSLTAFWWKMKKWRRAFSGAHAKNPTGPTTVQKSIVPACSICYSKIRAWIASGPRTWKWTRMRLCALIVLADVKTEGLREKLRIWIHAYQTWNCWNCRFEASTGKVGEQTTVQKMDTCSCAGVGYVT